MIRKEIYSIESILPLILDDPAYKFNFSGDMVRMGSLRLFTFKTKGIRCVECGISGKFFAKEKSHERDVSYHLNLYALDKDGQEVLMTKGHNLQPTCYHCNQDQSKKARKKVLY